MACRKCGKLQSIILGNFSYVAEQLFDIPVFKSPEFDRRIQICLSCNKSTWLTRGEFVVYVGRYTKEIIKSIGDLSGLPNLPKQEKDKKRSLFCMICKCPVEAKARVENEGCYLDKWK